MILLNAKGLVAEVLHMPISHHTSLKQIHTIVSQHENCSSQHHVHGPLASQGDMYVVVPLRIYRHRSSFNRLQNKMIANLSALPYDCFQSIRHVKYLGRHFESKNFVTLLTKLTPMTARLVINSLMWHAKHWQQRNSSMVKRVVVEPVQLIKENMCNYIFP